MSAKSHTFVICAYEESEFLEECIKSLVFQKDSSDIILVTSTPNQLINSLCEKYSIPFFINKGESGITQDWEFGLSKVTTKYATIAHQDDVYFDTYSKAVIEACDHSKAPIICFTDYYELRNNKIEKNNKLLSIKRKMLLPLRLKMFRRLKCVRRMILSFGNPICCPSVTYCINRIERPYFLNNYKSNEDWEAWERYSKLKGEFIYIPHAHMAHRIHEDSETSAIIASDERGAEDFDMFRKFWPKKIAAFLAEKYKESEKSNKI